MKPRCLFASLLIVVAILPLCSCRPPVIVAVPRSEEPWSLSEKLDVHFYLDASGSMHGFLPANGPRVTQFSELLNGADAVFHSIWQDANVHYWTFGVGPPREVTSIRGFTQFTEPETHIEDPIRHHVDSKNGRSQLKIIVTDLFQHYGDVGKLATELGKFLKEGDGVGILGVRSSYSGRVTELPGSIPEGGADSLPFYLLFVGPTPDVIKAMQAIEHQLHPGDGASVNNAVFHVVLSRRLMPQLEQPLVTVPIDVSHPGYTSEETMVPGEKEEGAQQIKIYHKRDTQVRLTLCVQEGAFANIGGNLFTVALELNETVRSWNNGKWIENEARSTAATAFRSEKWIDERGTAKAPYCGLPASRVIDERRLLIDSSKLVKNGVYVVQLDLPVEQTDFAAVNSWSLEDNDVHQIVQEGRFPSVNGRRPGRTPNLRFFLQTLAHTALQSEILWARYYIYVKVM